MKGASPRRRAPPDNCHLVAWVTAVYAFAQSPTSLLRLELFADGSRLVTPLEHDQFVEFFIYIFLRNKHKERAIGQSIL
jgi:hypothetical protein